MFSGIGGDRVFPYDMRPSDAIALAVRKEADIFVSEDVMKRAGKKEEELFGKKSFLLGHNIPVLTL